MGLKVHTNSKITSGLQSTGTGKSRLAGTLENGESRLPGTLKTKQPEDISQWDQNELIDEKNGAKNLARLSL